MVARDQRQPTVGELDAAALDELNRRAALAAQVGPYRRPYGVLKQSVYQAESSKQLAQNSTKVRVLFVTVSVLGSQAMVFNKTDSIGAFGLRVALSDNVPGQSVSYIDFILYPGDELHATAPAGTVLQVNEQSF